MRAAGGYGQALRHALGGALVRGGGLACGLAITIGHGHSWLHQ